ncbi:MAG: transcriptional regulator [Pedobacter sp.]|nr:MAG: transcriptional regulator [Pedobacter sp.]
MNKSLIFIASIIFLLYGNGKAQIATPQIVNYTNDQYKAGIQNWDIAQDASGILYFGNNDGLLSFNGRFWKLNRLPNFTSVRSVEIDSRNRIFVGGQDEAGYFFPEEDGVLKYHSIVSLIPEQYRKFADIWNISIINDAVLFRSTNLIVYYKDGVVKTFKPGISWDFAGKVNNQMFAHAKGLGLVVLNDGVWKPYANHPALDISAITSVMDYGKDTILVSTLKKGLFLSSNGKMVSMATSLDDVFYNDRIYTARKIDNDRYVIGTTSAGIYIINKKGKLLQKYNYKDGLQNNNVRGMLTDHNQNLWLALDDGIDYIAINSAVKSIFPDKNKQITSYAIRNFKDVLYIGTSNGLYATSLERGISDLSLSKGSFDEVTNSKGQVWSLSEINNKLLMAHEDGVYQVSGNFANQIYAGPGTWLFEPISNEYPARSIIAGTYLGLQKMDFKNESFFNDGKIEGLTETLRFMAMDSDGNIWASHPYRGVYKIEVYDNYKKIKKHTLYGNKEGLPSHLYNYVFKVKERIVVAAENGIYEYDKRSKKFKLFPLLNAAFKGLSIQYLKEDGNGNIWFISNKRVGILDFSRPSGGESFSVNYFPQLDGKVVGGFESIYTYNNENIFVGANKGAYHLNYTKFLKDVAKPSILLGSVKLFGKKDSVIFGGYFMDKGNQVKAQAASNILKLSNEFNSLQFEYSSTLFEQQNNIEFSYQLAGFDKAWAPWSQKSEKDYTNLPAGKYSFNVKARNSIGNESAAVTYTFEILPAWYLTVWMNLLYMIILGFVLYLLFKWQKKQHVIAQAKLSYLHQLELDRSEKEIVRLENEKLEADVTYKNRELSTMTMHLVQRGKVLGRIKEVISTIIKNHDINDSSPSFRHLIRLIRDVEKSDQDWDNFSMHFNTVNSDFFDKLKDKHPDLTPNELKLSAYLKMNLSTKEVAQLMNITIKAVEVGRYRLRKKLVIKPDINLYDYLMVVSRGAKKNNEL